MLMEEYGKNFFTKSERNKSSHISDELKYIIWNASKWSEKCIKIDRKAIIYRWKDWKLGLGDYVSIYLLIQ